MSPQPRALTSTACRRLLGQRGVGRVVFTEDALPAVATVNYAVVDGRLRFRTAAGTALARCVVDTVVAFNVDYGTVEGRESGDAWSVTVTGRCRPDEPDARVRAALDAWAPGPREEFFVLDLALVQGFRLDGSTERETRPNPH